MENVKKKLDALQAEIEKLPNAHQKHLMQQQVDRMNYIISAINPKPRPVNPDHVFIEGQNFRPHVKDVKVEETKPAPKRRRKKPVPKLDTDLLADNK